jgi:hypothetical protein
MYGDNGIKISLFSESKNNENSTTKIEKSTKLLFYKFKQRDKFYEHLKA